MSTSTSEVGEKQEDSGLRIRRDLFGGVVALGIAAFFLLNAGHGENLDWLFPRVLSYALAVMGVLLVGRGVFGFGDKMPVRPPLLAGQGVDVLVFIVVAIAYVLLLDVVGFWVSNALLIAGVSIYLETRRSLRSAVVSLIVAVAVCVAGYLILTDVFYLDFPEGFLM